MFRFAFLVLFLSLGNVCAGNVTTPSPMAPTSNVTTLAPTTKPTTLAPTTKPTTPAPTTNTTTLAPPTTPAPTTNATTPAPTTNATTPAPTTNATTLAPTTNATTLAPTTNATTPGPIPTTTPTPTLPPPATGNYSVKTNVNSTACLMAKFGLQIGFKLGGKDQEINLEPNVTTANGDCAANSSVLQLKSDKITIIFSFSNDDKNFRLHALNVTIQPSTGVTFSAANSNLTLWKAAVGSSYMCKKQQSYNITDALVLHTYDLRVQPFQVTKGEFSTAEECFLDSDFTFLVPIAVGVALSFLIILVLISYLIGRRKSRTGYQSV